MQELKRVIRDAAAIHEVSWSSSKKSYQMSVTEAVDRVTSDPALRFVARILLLQARTEVLDWVAPARDIARKLCDGEICESSLDRSTLIDVIGALRRSNDPRASRKVEDILEYHCPSRD